MNEMKSVPLEDRLTGGVRRGRTTARIERLLHHYPGITEEFVIEKVRQNYREGEYAKYALSLMRMIGMDVADAKELIEDMGLGEYINSRMDEAETQVKTILMGGSDEGDSASRGLQTLRILRDMDYRRRTPPEGTEVAEPPKEGHSIKVRARYDRLGHERQ